MPELFDYQRDGVEWIIGRDCKCILADDPGLGKTAQTITAAHRLNAFPWLICSPANLLFNWRNEIGLWAPDLLDCVQVVDSGAAFDPSAGARAFIMSYTMAKNLKKELAAVAPQTVILDEAHEIKNHETATTRALLPMCIKARHAILLTGTPVLNRVVELWPLLVAIGATGYSAQNYHRFGQRFCGARKEEIWHPVYKRKIEVWNYQGYSNLLELHGLLKKYVLRRKASILGDLPPKSRVKHVVSAEPPRMSARVRERCKNALARSFGDVDKALAVMKRGSAKEIADEMLEHYRLVGKRKTGAAIELMLDTPLPVIVYAHHTEVLQNLREAAEARGLRVARIIGGMSPARRQRVVDKFQGGEFDVLLCSNKAGNAGMTLTRGCEVIVVELPWSPAISLQIEARVHRIGQTRPVRVRYLVMEGTVDDSLWRMQRRKSRIVDLAIDGHVDNVFKEDLVDDSGVDDDIWDAVRQVLSDQARGVNEELWPDS